MISANESESAFNYVAQTQKC